MRAAFCERSCLPRFRSGHVDAADFGDALDEAGDVRSEAFLNAGDGIFGVLDGVVKEGGGERGGVHAHICKDVGDLKKMGEIGISGAAQLVAMTLRSNFVSTADNPRIFGRPVFAEFFEEFFEARFELADSAVALKAQRNITGRRHVQVYARNGQRASRGAYGGRGRANEKKRTPSQASFR